VQAPPLPDSTPSHAHEGEDALPYWQHDDESIAFFRVSLRGKVHVRARYKNATSPNSEHQATANFAMGKVVAFCGTSALWWEAGYLGSFPDELLCPTCHKKFPGDTNLLFEHETSDA
jgi:hypothetical protein